MPEGTGSMLLLFSIGDQQLKLIKVVTFGFWN